MKQSKEKKCYAKVNPDFLKQVSDMLKHEIKSEKDTANYNSLVISNFIDKASISLRDSGILEIKPGDVFRILNEIDAVNFNRPSTPELFNLEGPNYDLNNYPFDHKLELEQRTKHILRTEALDTFDSLMDELDVYMPRYISMELWGKIKMAISKGNERVSKNNLIFLGPETIVGKEMKLSSKEMERLGFSPDSGNLTYDLRPDGPDLIAMKELVRVLKGEDVEDLSFAPGFFAKYTHELNDEKIGALIFHVIDDKLKSIEEFVFDHRRGKYELNDGMHEDNRFTPVQAVALFSRLMYDRVQKLDKEHLLKEFKINEKYFFVFHGFISAPKDNSHFGYESDPKLNEEIIRSGEVYLVKKKSKDETTKEKVLLNGKVVEENYDKNMITRIYFVPEKYGYFHPYHQHGSIIFGNNDYSYHSSTKWADIGFARDWFLEKIYPIMPFQLLEPSFVFVSAKKYVGISNPRMEEILHGPRGEDFTNAFFNHYEENKSLFYRLLKGKLRRYKTNRDIPVPSTEEESDKMSEELDQYAKFFEAFSRQYLIENYAPLHKKWTLRQYLNDGCGIVPNRVLGVIDKAAEKVRHNQGLESIKLSQEYHKNNPKK
jgi:hypothetical protein